MSKDKTMLCIKNTEEVYFSVSDSVNDISQGVSLRLLNTIERTVASLSKEQGQLENLIRLITSHTPSEDCQNDDMIDPEDRVTEKLLETEGLLEERITTIESMRESAKVDPELNGAHEESVVMEFERTIDCMASLYNAVTILRQRITEHDANLDTIDGSFTNAEDLIAHIGD